MNIQKFSVPKSMSYAMKRFYLFIGDLDFHDKVTSDCISAFRSPIFLKRVHYKSSCLWVVIKTPLARRSTQWLLKMLNGIR